MQTLSTTKWCHYAVVLGQRDKDTFRKIPVWLNRLLCKPHVWRVCKAYKLFFPSERDYKLWYPSPPLPKKNKTMQIATLAGGTILTTVRYFSVIFWPLLRNAICWSSFQWKKFFFMPVVLPESSGFPRVVSRSSYSLWWLYIWCCLARWQLIGA